MLFLQTLAFLVLGIFFLILGLRGRCLGPEPRCRSCTYQLTGRLDAERCPECGTVLTPKTLVYGLRKPRWWSMIAVVVVVVIFWAVPGRVLWKLRKVDSYEYYTVSMLLWRAKVDQPRAIHELARRAYRGELSSESSYEIAELGLRKLEQWPSWSPAWAWSRLLKSMDEGGLLSAQQRDQLFLTFAQPSLTVRPVIRQGDPIVVALDYQSSPAGLNEYGFWHDPARVSVGGYEIFRASGDAWRDRHPDWRRTHPFPVCIKTMTFPAGSPPTGTAKLNYVGRHVFLPVPDRLPQRVLPRGPDISSQSPVERCTEIPFWSGEIALSGTVEILPADAPDPVRWVVATEAESQLRDAIDVCLWVWRRLPGGRYAKRCVREKEVVSSDVAPLECVRNHEVLYIYLGLSDPPPIPVAFDLVIEADGSELDTTTDIDRDRPSSGVCSGPSALVWNREESGDANLTVKVPPFTANELFVVLRGSRDVARKTVDMYEVWQGELRFGPFRVEHTSP